MSPWRIRLISWLCWPSMPVMICDDTIFGLIRSLALDAHPADDRVDRGLDLALVAIVELEHAVRALDDLHAGPARRGLQRGVGELVDRDARRDLDERGGLVLERHEAGADRLQKAGQLRLQRVEDGERAELHRRRRYHSRHGPYYRPRRSRADVRHRRRAADSPARRRDSPPRLPAAAAAMSFIIKPAIVTCMPASTMTSSKMPPVLALSPCSSEELHAALAFVGGPRMRQLRDSADRAARARLRSRPARDRRRARARTAPSRTTRAA